MMSHERDPATSSGNLDLTIPMIFPATDYDDVDPIFLHHLPPPPDYNHHHHHHHHDHYDYIERTAAAGGDALSSWGEDEKAGTLESIVDQATRLVPITGAASTLIFQDGNIKMMNDNMSMWFGNYNPQLISTTTTSVNITTSTTMTVNDAMVPPSKNQQQHHNPSLQVPGNNIKVVTTKDTQYEREIEHRNGKEKEEEEEEIDAANIEADHDMDNSVVKVPSKCKDGRMIVDDQDEDPTDACSLLTYTTTSSTRSVIPDHHLQREGRKKVKNLNTNSSANKKRSKATILHNKAERKRRDRISQRMEELQRLVPNICYKSKATMLDQVIEYIKKLQTQQNNQMVMMSNVSYPMMIPMPYYMFMRQQQQQQQQQQLQMSMMAGAQMGMGLGFGSMHTNPIVHPNMSMNTSTIGTSWTPAIVHPTFIIGTSWTPAIVNPTFITPPSRNHSY